MQEKLQTHNFHFSQTPRDHKLHRVPIVEQVQIQQTIIEMPTFPDRKWSGYNEESKMSDVGASCCSIWESIRNVVFSSERERMVSSVLCVGSSFDYSEYDDGCSVIDEEEESVYFTPKSPRNNSKDQYPMIGEESYSLEELEVVWLASDSYDEDDDMEVILFTDSDDDETDEIVNIDDLLFDNINNDDRVENQADAVSKSSTLIKEEDLFDDIGGTEIRSDTDGCGDVVSVKDCVDFVERHLEISTSMPSDFVDNGDFEDRDLEDDVFSIDFADRDLDENYCSGRLLDRKYTCIQTEPIILTQSDESKTKEDSSPDDIITINSLNTQHDLQEYLESIVDDYHMKIQTATSSDHQSLSLAHPPRNFFTKMEDNNSSADLPISSDDGAHDPSVSRRSSNMSSRQSQNNTKPTSTKPSRASAIKTNDVNTSSHLKRQVGESRKTLHSMQNFGGTPNGISQSSYSKQNNKEATCSSNRSSHSKHASFEIVKKMVTPTHEYADRQYDSENKIQASWSSDLGVDDPFQKSESTSSQTEDQLGVANNKTSLEKDANEKDCSDPSTDGALQNIHKSIHRRLLSEVKNTIPVEEKQIIEDLQVQTRHLNFHDDVEVASTRSVSARINRAHKSRVNPSKNQSRGAARMHESVHSRKSIVSDVFSDIESIHGKRICSETGKSHDSFSASEYSNGIPNQRSDRMELAKNTRTAGKLRSSMYSQNPISEKPSVITRYPYDGFVQSNTVHARIGHSISNHSSLAVSFTEFPHHSYRSMSSDERSVSRSYNNLRQMPKERRMLV